MEDLEIKNRMLVEKLNAQVYQQAAVYKEKTMNALMRSSKNESNVSPHRNSIKGQAGQNNTYLMGMTGQNESAFARSPLDLKRVSNIQPTYAPERSVKEKSYSPLRQSRSPAKRGQSNSPSRVAAALQNSQGVGYQSYLNRSPLDLANNRRTSGSPLRQKSPPRNEDANVRAAL